MDIKHNIPRYRDCICRLEGRHAPVTRFFITRCVKREGKKLLQRCPAYRLSPQMNLSAFGLRHPCNQTAAPCRPKPPELARCQQADCAPEAVSDPPCYAKGAANMDFCGEGRTEQYETPAGPETDLPLRQAFAFEDFKLGECAGDDFREEFCDEAPCWQNVRECCEEGGCKEPPDAEGLHGRGLLHYRKWWERSTVDVFVYGEKLTGIPIFTDKNTLRVVNSTYSYFIPLEKVDYIRTNDGLENCEPIKGAFC